MPEPTAARLASTAPPLRRLGWIRFPAGATLVTLALIGLHTWILWRAMGGWTGLTNDWPLLQADFGLHYPHGLATRAFLQQSGFAAGYDPSFMAGFPMSVVSGTSSTWSNTAISLFGSQHPAVAFKASVWLGMVLAPLLLGWASRLFGATMAGVAWSVGFYLIYFWTDFPRQYVYYGMVSFFLAIPLGLVAVATLVRYLDGGGRLRWAAAALACSALFFVHVTSPLVVGPAGLLAYALVSWRSYRRTQPIPGTRHAGFWALAVVILAVNAFWWLPAVWLRSTVGVTEFAFAHPESLLNRLGEIFWKEAPIEACLIGLGGIGLLWLGSFRPVAATGLTGMIAAGFTWGYLAGAFRTFDALQPGRQTYACYAGLCVAAGLAVGAIADWVRAAQPGRFDRWLTAAAVLVGLRIFGPAVVANSQDWAFGPEPILTSQPLPVLTRLIADLRQHCQPGDRLLYEESGLSIPGEVDPFFGRHLSPILPAMTGVEVLGGPYLHTPIQTNFTQFGEGKLFGDLNWGRDQFVRYARLYRPVAIACWTRKARAFCRQNPDLIEILDDDGVLLFGRVLGFGGATIRGRAEVAASLNRLIVRNAVADGDGLLVLRYHATPCLVTDPPIPLEPVYLEQDPVPFIGLRPTSTGPITIRLVLPPPQGWFASPALVGRP